LQHLLDIVSSLKERGIELISLSESIDTTSASGRLVFSIFGALAEYERSMIADDLLAPGVTARHRRPQSRWRYDMKKAVVSGFSDRRLFHAAVSRGRERPSRLRPIVPSTGIG
jgi:Resolvase, N terminal domain